MRPSTHSSAWLHCETVRGESIHPKAPPWHSIQIQITKYTIARGTRHSMCFLTVKNHVENLRTRQYVLVVAVTTAAVRSPNVTHGPIQSIWPLFRQPTDDAESKSVFNQMSQWTVRFAYSRAFQLNKSKSLRNLRRQSWIFMHIEINCRIIFDARLAKTGELRSSQCITVYGHSVARVIT